MKKVLFISYPFPPISSGGTLRVVKFANLLPTVSWQPIILSPAKDDNGTQLTSIPKELAGLIWYRSNRILDRFFVAYNQKQTQQGEQDLIRAALAAIFRFWSRVILLILPDIYAIWLPRTVSLGKKIIEKEKPHLIYTSSPPHSVHLIGYFLKRFSRLPWVLELRDPWVGELGPNKRFRTGIAKLYEKFLLSRANRIVVTSLMLKKDLIERYPKLIQKIDVITNGYDEEDFKKVDTIETFPNKKFIICYNGTMIERIKDPSFFLAGLKKFFADHPETREQTLVRIIGFIPPKFQPLFNDPFIAKSVECLGRKPHQDALCIQKQADLSLVFISLPMEDQRAHVIAGKIFDCLRLGKPILALIPVNNEMSDIINEVQGGTVVSYNDIDAISQALFAFFSKWQQGKLTPIVQSTKIKKYDRRNLVRSLAQVFNSLV